MRGENILSVPLTGAQPFPRAASSVLCPGRVAMLSSGHD